MESTVTNNSKKETRMDSEKRKAEPSFEPKNKPVNEKEKVEERKTRPKRATKTTFDYYTFDYSIGMRMPMQKNNSSKDDVNQTLEQTVTDSYSESDMEELRPPPGDHVFHDVYPATRNLDNVDKVKQDIIQELLKTLTDSDSESDMEELRPPPADLIFDDIYSATRNLDNADKEKLVNMHRLWQIVWTCPKRRYEVKPKHCHNLVSNDVTIDSVIGSWMSILEDKFKNKPNVPTCYLGNIYFRAFVRRKSTKALNKELDKMKGKRLLCFPVCTPISGDPDKNPNHWTLIVLDVKERKWTHFNTLTGIAIDWNYHHNEELMDWVDENLREEYVETERENYKDTPQQPSGSYDCGICLLMILEQLMLGKTKEQIKELFEFNKKEIAKYRTRMVQTILHLGKIQKEEKDVACGIIPVV